MARDNKERIHYIRKASNTVEPSDDEEKDLFNLANRVPFDDRVNHQAEISDLNITIIQNYLKEVKSSLYEKAKTGDFVEVCSDMNIISNLPEYVKPKNVGLMFFSMEPDKFFPYTQIDVVQFPDGLGGNDIIENTFKGPIHQQLRDALHLLRIRLLLKRLLNIRIEQRQIVSLIIHMQQLKKLYLMRYTIVHTMFESRLKCVWNMTE